MYNSFKNLYENTSPKPNGLGYIYFVKTYVCDVVEIDRKDIVYWSEKATFQKKDVEELVGILKRIECCLEDANFSIHEAKTFEFGNELFSNPNVVFYKDKVVAISDGRGGRVVIDNPSELKSLNLLLQRALEEY